MKEYGIIKSLIEADVIENAVEEKVSKSSDNKQSEYTKDFEKVITLTHHIAILNGILTREKAEKARLERKYNRYYNLVEDFYAYLLRIGKVKEFTLFHEEKGMGMEAD